jgi:hypothetical protein
MSTQEFYIRGPTDTDARGPFTVEQLVTLGETGGIDSETLFYDAATEQWAPIATSEKVKSLVFPEKKRLTVKPKQHVAMLNVEQEEHRPITVQQMLAAAEGRTDDTSDKRGIMEMHAKAARAGLGAACLILLFSATALILPHLEIVTAMDFGGMLQHPIVFLGFVDVICAIFLLLGTAAIYPFVRFRAAFGIGFFGLLYWLQDQPLMALMVVGGSIGLYFCTVVLSYLPVVLSALLGLAGIGGLAYFVLMT